MVIFFLPFSIALMYPLSISSTRQMSPCDIPLRVLIFLMLSPSLLLINIIIAYEILHFQTILYYNSSVEAAKQNQKFPFHFFLQKRLTLLHPPHHPPRKRRKVRNIFGFCSRDRRVRSEYLELRKTFRIRLRRMRKVYCSCKERTRRAD